MCCLRWLSPMGKCRDPCAAPQLLLLFHHRGVGTWGPLRKPAWQPAAWERRILFPNTQRAKSSSSAQSGAAIQVCFPSLKRWPNQNRPPAAREPLIYLHCRDKQPAQIGNDFRWIPGGSELGLSPCRGNTLLTPGMLLPV